MAVSLAVKTAKSRMFGSVSDIKRDDLYGVGGSVLDRTCGPGGFLPGEELGEHRGVRGYLDLLGELRQ